VTVSLGFVLLDAHWRSVFVNDAARDALVNAPSGQTAPDTIESALQKLEELITVSLTDGKPPLGFTFAGRRCRTFQLSCQRGDRETFNVVLLGPQPDGQSYAQAFSEQFRLTPRETEALDYYIQGLPAKGVAQQMRISTSTAKAFLRMITIKMGVSSRAEMMSKVLDHMCPASLTCPFRETVPHKQPGSSPND
jgi:DNA-binding CsgD family transcriptional regulator